MKRACNEGLNLIRYGYMSVLTLADLLDDAWDHALFAEFSTAAKTSQDALQIKLQQLHESPEIEPKTSSTPASPSSTDEQEDNATPQAKQDRIEPIINI